MVKVTERSRGSVYISVSTLDETNGYIENGWIYCGVSNQGTYILRSN